MMKDLRGDNEKNKIFFNFLIILYLNTSISFSNDYLIKKVEIVGNKEF